MRRKIIAVILLLIPLFVLAIDHYVVSGESLDQSYDDSKEWQYIREHQNEYKDSLLDLALRNKETIPFVASYPQKHDLNPSMSLKKDLQSSQVPLLLQWDDRWGYRTYGNNMMAINGCGPTCLSMVLSYLTQDETINPYFLAQYAYRYGYYSHEGTAWSFMKEVPLKYNIQVEELSLNEEKIINELNNGHPIICSVRPGLFTTTGHFIVLREYKNGKIYVNDPNSRIKSQRGYSFDEIQHDIKNLWSYHL